MKKIILLFAMMLAVAGVQAKSNSTYACNVTFPTDKGSNCSYDTGSKLFSWTAANTNYMTVFQNLKGKVNLERYRFLNVKVTNLSAGGDYRILIYCDNKTSSASYTKDCTGDERIDLTAITLGTGETQDNINLIRIAGSGSVSTGSFNIVESDVYLETGDYEAMDITTTINSSSDKDAPFAWSATKTLSTISNNLGSTGNAVIFGYANNNDDDHGSFNVAGYDNVTVNLSAFDSGKNTSVRLLKGTGTSNVEFTTASGTLSYTKVLSFTTCASIKAGAGASNCQNVSSVVFIKEFNAENEKVPFSISASASSSVAYDRSFTTDQISTICLPFDLSASEVTATGGKFYAFESATASSLKFSEVNSTTAYTPYLFVPGSNTTPFANLTDKEIKASDGATTTVTKNGFTFNGTLAKTNISSGAYGFNGGELKKAGKGVTIKAFRGYFTGAFSGARSLDIDLGDGSVTGISKIQTETSNDAPIYNLNGQRVGTDYKGIVIQNGKKVIKK